MEAALPNGQMRRVLERDWLIAPAAVLLGIALGALIAFSPRVGLGLSFLPVLAFVILPRPNRGLYLIAVLLPFESVASLSSDFTAVKLVGLVAFAAWFVKLIRTRQTRINPANRTNLILILFLAVSALSITQAQYPAVGADRLLTMIQLVALYFMVADLTSDGRTFNNVLLVLIAAGIPAAGIAIAQFVLGGAGRAIGVYPDPNYSALNVLILIPLAVAFIDRSRGRSRAFFWALFFFLVLGVIVNFSRGATLALVVMFFLLSREARIEDRLRRGMKLFFLAVLVGGVLLALVNPRFSLTSMMSTGGSGRLDIWRTAWHMWLDHPWLGVGIQNYKFAYFRYASHLPSVHYIMVKAMVAHNTYIETVVESGIIGFGLFAALLSSTIFKLARARRAYARLSNGDLAVAASMLLISLAGFMVGGVFLSTMPKKALWFLLGLAAGRTQTGPAAAGRLSDQ